MNNKTINYYNNLKAILNKLTQQIIINNKMINNNNNNNNNSKNSKNSKNSNNSNKMINKIKYLLNLKIINRF